MMKGQEAGSQQGVKDDLDCFSSGELEEGVDMTPEEASDLQERVTLRITGSTEEKVPLQSTPVGASSRQDAKDRASKAALRTQCKSVGNAGKAATSQEVAESRKTAFAGPTKTERKNVTNRELAEVRKNAGAKKTALTKVEDSGNEAKIVGQENQQGGRHRPPGAFDFGSCDHGRNSEAFDSTVFDSVVTLKSPEFQFADEHLEGTSPIAAHTVEDELEAVVVGFGQDEVEIQEEYEKELKTSRRRRLCIHMGVVAICLTVAVIAAVVGVNLSHSPDEVVATSSPTFSPAPTLSPSNKPSVSPTASPTVSPTTAVPTIGARKCFESALELQEAVDSYVVNNSQDTEVAATYGWPIGVWCTGQVSSLQELFSGYRNQAMLDFNEKIGGWDVSRVTNLQGTFERAQVFNQDLSSWDVSRVVTFESCFEDASKFDQSLDNWDVSSATTFRSFFSGATEFGTTTTQDLRNWQTSRVTDMHFTFANARRFAGDISTWDVSNVQTMHRMFVGAQDFSSDLSGWDVSQVTDMTRMFKWSFAFNSDISGWDVSKVEDMIEMFAFARSFNQDISTWDMSSVLKSTDMFNEAESFNQDLCAWGSSDTLGLSSTALVGSMFAGTNCTSRESPMFTTVLPGPFCVPCNNYS